MSFLDLDPIKFAERNFTLNGEPMTIINDRLENARHYLKKIYYTTTFELAKVKKPLIIVKGRQVEMTTTFNNIIAYWLTTIPFFTILYVVPLSDQAKRFSETRFDPLFRYKVNPDILVPLKHGTFNKSVKEFENGSTLYIYAASNEGDNVRGLSAHALIKDEYQDLDVTVEETTDMCISHSPYKINISLGTPKYRFSRFEDRWEESTKNYYYLVCPVCSEEFVLTLSTLSDGYNIKCPKCGHKEDKRKIIPFGKWKPQNPDAPVIGFHLSQLYIPTITKEDIDKEIKRKEKEGADVAKYVKNEVLGEFYEGHVQRPAVVDIMPSFNRNLPYDIKLPITQKVFMGIDWGGWNSKDNDPEASYTVVSIGAFDKDGKLFVNKVEIIDNKDELAHIDRISYLMNYYNIFLAVADKGYGKIKNMELLKRFGSRFKMCKYLQGSASTLYKVMEENNTILVNKDYSLEELYSAMKYGKLAIPLNKETEWIVDQFMNFQIIIEQHGDQVYKKFIKVEGKNKRTDAVHSINYLRIAAFFDPKAAEHSALALIEVKHRPIIPVVLAGRIIDPTLAKLNLQFKRNYLKKRNYYR